MVRGPTIGAVTTAWLSTIALAIWMSVMPARTGSQSVR
jgi:hypothetical protein